MSMISLIMGRDIMKDDMIPKSTLTRRQFLGFLSGVTGLTGAGGYYVRYVAPYNPEITRITLKPDNLPAGLSGLTFVHISDIHHSPVVSIDYIQHCVGMINDLRPDIIFITGDFISQSACFIAPCAEVLGGLKSPYGIFAVPGNHDNWIDTGELSGELLRHGIQMLVNEHACIQVKGDPLYIIGLDDFWTGWPRIDRAARGIPEGAKRIVLMHNPDLFEKISPGRYDLVLAGHTHGGQVNLPFLGALVVPSRFGRKYARGLFTLNGSTLYVNRGLGLATPAVRFMCPPEITLFSFASS